MHLAVFALMFQTVRATPSSTIVPQPFYETYGPDATAPPQTRPVAVLHLRANNSIVGYVYTGTGGNWRISRSPDVPPSLERWFAALKIVGRGPVPVGKKLPTLPEGVILVRCPHGGCYAPPPAGV